MVTLGVVHGCVVVFRRGLARPEWSVFSTGTLLVGWHHRVPHSDHKQQRVDEVEGHGCTAQSCPESSSNGAGEALCRVVPCWLSHDFPCGCMYERMCCCCTVGLQVLVSVSLHVLRAGMFFATYHVAGGTTLVALVVPVACAHYITSILLLGGEWRRSALMGALVLVSPWSLLSLEPVRRHLRLFRLLVGVFLDTGLITYFAAALQVASPPPCP